jgi:hypothetical protein
MVEEDYTEEMAELFRGGLYTINPAGEEDIHWIAGKAGKLYGSNDAIPVKVKLSWFRKNPNGFWAIKNHTGMPIGSCELLPLKKPVIDKIIEGSIRKEEKISPDDIYSPQEIEEADHVYIENVMSLREDRTPNPFAVMVCMMEFPRIIEHLGVSPANAKIYAMPIKEFHTARGICQSTSEGLLQRLGFWKITKVTEQEYPFYCAELDKVLSSSAFYRDKYGSREVYTKRRGAISRKKGRVLKKTVTKFRPWDNPGDAHFIVTNKNRIKFSYEGKVRDLRIKDFVNTHTVMYLLYSKNMLEPEDIRPDLCSRRTKPSAFFREVNRHLNRKINDMGFVGVPHDVKFIDRVPHSDAYHCTIEIIYEETPDRK